MGLKLQFSLWKMVQFQFSAHMIEYLLQEVEQLQLETVYTIQNKLIESAHSERNRNATTCCPMHCPCTSPSSMASR